MKFLTLFFGLLFAFNANAADSVVFQPAVSASVTTTSTQKLAANINRKYLIVENNGTATVYLKTDTIHSGTEGVALLAGQSYEPAIAPINSIWMVSASGTQSVTIVEGN